MKHTPKWKGLKMEIRVLSDEDKDKFFIGNKVWDTWVSSKI